MKIAVLSDTRLPTRRDYPGHGLGKMALMLAEGLAGRGHAVTLFAGMGSQFAGGALVMSDDERRFDEAGDLASFDAILDSTHGHGLQSKLGLQKSLQTAAIVNWSQDREAPPGRCAVYPSEAHKAWHVKRGAAATGRVVHNGVEIPDVSVEPEDYFVYLSMFHAPKGPVMAANAARLAGVRLVMAGPTPPSPPVGGEYVGPVSGDMKLRLLAGARALVFPASVEAGPVTPLEAQAVGTPVIHVPYGAADENCAPCGLSCRDTLEMADGLHNLATMAADAYSDLRDRVRDWVRRERSVERMVDGFEQALRDAAGGMVW